MYCMPVSGEDQGTQVKSGIFLNHSELLSYEELLRVVRLAIDLGMNKLRLTGGEPLIRRGVLDFIESLSELKGLDEVRLTTNGVLLGEYAERLYGAGVRHINVSLDTLHADKFKKITGKNLFTQVHSSIFKALEFGFKIKLNVVAMKGVNDDEFIDFAGLALAHPMQVRFIEFMPVGDRSSWEKDKFISADEIKNRIAAIGELTPFTSRHGDGPARMYELRSENGQKGRVGFISPISHHFCDKCNRLRLTSEGRLRSCLLNDRETDLKSLLRQGASDLEVMEAIRRTVLDKPKGHNLQTESPAENNSACSGRMSRIGG